MWIIRISENADSLYMWTITWLLSILATMKMSIYIILESNTQVTPTLLRRATWLFAWLHSHSTDRVISAEGIEVHPVS